MRDYQQSSRGSFFSQETLHGWQKAGNKVPGSQIRASFDTNGTGKIVNPTDNKNAERAYTDEVKVNDSFREDFRRLMMRV